ncbi:MAG: hypothetical protein ACYS8K_08500 [Planctomycetota bacterium]|jgi:hypothetical protein
MKLLVLSTAALAGLAIGAGQSAGPPQDDNDRPELPIGVCLVREMGYIPELNSWGSDKAGKLADHVDRAGDQWRKQIPSLKKLITPRLARRLSRWARKQMAAYKTVPPLANVKFKPVRVNKQQRKIVFEGTLDTLPTHSRIVTRWLRVYLLYDEPSSTVLRTTITIRGQVLE